MTIQEQFNLVAKQYDENRRKFISCFDDYYISTTDFLAKSLNKSPTCILDLGSGTGLLPSFWYKYFPEADYFLVDIAEEMLGVAKKRFENLSNIHYKILDYTNALPDVHPDLIMSALSIHHLEHEVKQSLFKKIYNSLGSDGSFINYDQFCSEDAKNNEKIEKYWVESIQNSGISQVEYDRWVERKKLDRECSIEQEIAWLREVGFTNVECVYFNQKFGVIQAIK